MRIERDVSVIMRDGVDLGTDLYLPDVPGRYPVLLQRTPYGKRLVAGSGFSPKRATGNGYVVAVQDTRGRFASGGDFRPYEDDGPDGFDTIMWLADQPWSNGRVGMYGTSYMGTVQYLAAATQPEPLKALVPSQTGASFYDGWAYDGGAFNLANRVGWTMALLSDVAEKKSVPVPASMRKAISALSDVMTSSTDPHVSPQRRSDLQLTLATKMHRILSTLPLDALPIPRDVAGYLLDWMEHETYDDYWKRLDATWSYDSITLPVLHIGGWYDLFLSGTIQNYLALADRAARTGAELTQRLLIGPWTHGSFSRFQGDVDFGPEADSSRVQLGKLHMDWFDQWLKDDAANGTLNDPVTIFVMGVNRWRGEEAWPPRGCAARSWFLAGGGSANGRSGDGVLSVTRPLTDAVDGYVYDPLDPVPSVGGNMLGLGSKPGPCDRAEVEARHDVLVYTSEPLEHDVEAFGPASVRLWASTDGPDTDFCVALVDVHADGFAQPLAEGILRARFRNSPESTTPLESGQVYEFNLDLGSICNTFGRGHRLRLDVSSSNFPHYTRNLNTGGRVMTDSASRVATQAVHHGPAYVSELRLHVRENG